MLMGRVRVHTVLREEQAAIAQFALVPDLDMAGARGSAFAALDSLQRVNSQTRGGAGRSVKS